MFIFILNSANDYTFSWTEGKKRVEYGKAGDCYSLARCPQGRFSINLRGTALRLSPEVTWVPETSNAFLEITKVVSTTYSSFWNSIWKNIYIYIQMTIIWLILFCIFLWLCRIISESSVNAAVIAVSASQKQNWSWTYYLPSHIHQLLVRYSLSYFHRNLFVLSTVCIWNREFVLQDIRNAFSASALFRKNIIRDYKPWYL